MKVESHRRSITKNLKEENERAVTNSKKAQDEEDLLPAVCRRSPRINKTSKNSRL
jgi:hypothetical protein